MSLHTVPLLNLRYEYFLYLSTIIIFSSFHISVFMSHDGAQCLKDHREDIMKCINASLPNIFSPQEKKHHSSVINHLIFFSRENCR